MIDPCNHTANAGNGNAPHFHGGVSYHLPTDHTTLYHQIQLLRGFGYNLPPGLVNFRNGLVSVNYKGQIILIQCLLCVGQEETIPCSGGAAALLHQQRFTTMSDPRQSTVAAAPQSPSSEL